MILMVQDFKILDCSFKLNVCRRTYFVVVAIFLATKNVLSYGLLKASGLM